MHALIHLALRICVHSVFARDYFNDNNEYLWDTQCSASAATAYLLYVESLYGNRCCCCCCEFKSFAAEQRKNTRRAKAEIIELWMDDGLLLWISIMSCMHYVVIVGAVIVVVVLSH